MIGLSTFWTAQKRTGAASIIKPIKDLGVKQIELDFHLTQEEVSGLRNSLEKEEIEVVAVRHPCPLPKGMSKQHASDDPISIASGEEDERQRAVKLVFKTMEVAAQFGAKVVVIPAGRVSMPFISKTLYHKYPNTSGKLWEDKVNEMVERRWALMKIHMKQLIKSLQEIVEQAAKLNLKVAIKNRMYFEEIPLIEELEAIFDVFPPELLGFWYDVGLAKVAENARLGKNHLYWAHKFEDRMYGVYLHDTRGIEPYKLPGNNGEIDFNVLRSYIRDDVFRILLPSPEYGSGEVMKSKTFLEALRY